MFCLIGSQELIWGEGKIIIFTNFDTAQDDKQKLASYANFIYSTDTTLPVQSISLDNVPGSTVDYVKASRINWHISESKTPLIAPSVDIVKVALASGIQCVPIPFLSNPMASIKDLWSMWNGAPYILKPEATRYTQPNPIVPAKVSQKLNASIQGQEPGKVVVN